MLSIVITRSTTTFFILVHRCKFQQCKHAQTPPPYYQTVLWVSSLAASPSQFLAVPCACCVMSSAECAVDRPSGSTVRGCTPDLQRALGQQSLSLKHIAPRPR